MIKVRMSNKYPCNRKLIVFEVINYRFNIPNIHQPSLIASFF